MRTSRHLKPLPAADADRRQVHRVRLLRGRSARRTGLRCRRGSASSAGARSRASSRWHGHRRPGVRDASALRLPRDRHLRWLRTLRHRVPGRHRDRHSDQGAARTPRRARSRGASRTLSPTTTRLRPPAVRFGLAVANALHGLVGTRVMQASLDELRKLSGGRTAQVVAGTGAGRALHAGAARTAAGRWRRCRRLFSQLRRAQHGRAARRRRASMRCRSRPSDCSRKAGFDVVYPRRLGRAVLRAAVREQGPRDSGRPQVGRARSGVARRERRRPLADRVRHEPLRLSDEALPRVDGSRSRTASSSSTTRCCRASTIERKRDLRRHPSGMQRAQDGHRRQASSASRDAAARTW